MSQGTAPTAERRPRTVLHWVIQITGELLITIGLLLLLFVGESAADSRLGNTDLRFRNAECI